MVSMISAVLDRWFHSSLAASTLQCMWFVLGCMGHGVAFWSLVPVEPLHRMVYSGYSAFSDPSHLSRPAPMVICAGLPQNGHGRSVFRISFLVFILL